MENKEELVCSVQTLVLYSTTSTTQLHKTVKTEDDFRSGCRNVSQSSHVTPNSPSQDYTHPDDQLHAIVTWSTDDDVEVCSLLLHYYHQVTIKMMERTVIFF